MMTPIEEDDMEDKVPLMAGQSSSGVRTDIKEAAFANHPDPWGKGYKELYCICALLYLNSTMAGFDGSLLGNINALPEFHRYFGLDQPGMETGLMFSSVQMGSMIGALFLWLADWKGRIFCIRTGSIGVILSVFLQANASDVHAFIIGRFTLGFFSTIACKGSTMFLIEVAPPKYRGTVAGMYNTLYYFGSLLATTSVVISQRAHPDTDLAWKLPIWYQTICPAIVAFGIMFVPESPRWLIANNHVEEARRIIVRFHANGDASHPIVDLEMSEMVEDLRASGGLMTVASYFDISGLFRTKGRRYRIFILVCMSWFGQFSGNNIMSYYLPQMVTDVGITSTDTKLILNGVYAIVGWIAAASGARLHDVFGRRKMLFGCTCGLVVCLSIITAAAGAYEHTHSQVMSGTLVIWIYIFGIVFALGYTSMQPIYPAEVMTNDMRAKGMALSSFTAGTAGFVNTAVAPIAMATYGYWFYAFFVLWDVLEAAVIYKYFVETKGRTLEELDEVFESPNPAVASVTKRKTRGA
ncbi:Lactose permease [Drechslerella dactyloides]|uniref:Lactose permease n=1 Tax=Drechslerella dactyloides TaxID=74499 RepID=A0AAD6IW27_DREDA|nr:Lactose permease [Drechslerella dactyloides]